MIQYQVRPITRYVVTRYEKSERCGSCDAKGEYDNADVAYEVAYALCKAEHEQLGLPLGSAEIIYPDKIAKPLNLGAVIGVAEGKVFSL
jgi:hypothetical protein